MCHPKQLISRVVVIVKDLKLQPQVLFMRTHLQSDIEDTIKDFVVLSDLSFIEKEVSPVRIKAIFLGL